jgi:hypothetical protein
VVTKEAADRIDTNQQTQQEEGIEHRKTAAAAEADLAVAEADRSRSESEKNRAEAEAHRGKAVLSTSKGEEAIRKSAVHDADAGLKEAQTEVALSTVGIESGAQGPSEVDYAQAEQVRALIPHDIEHARRKADTESANAELVMAKARAAEKHPALTAQEVDTEKASGELTRAKAKAALKPKPAAVKPKGGKK